MRRLRRIQKSSSQRDDPSRRNEPSPQPPPRYRNVGRTAYRRQCGSQQAWPLPWELGDASASASRPSAASEYALETGLTFGGIGSPAVPLWTEKPLCCEVLFMGALFG